MSCHIGLDLPAWASGHAPPQAAGSGPLRRLPPRFKVTRVEKAPGAPHESGSRPEKRLWLRLSVESVLVATGAGNVPAQFPSGQPRCCCDHPILRHVHAL